MEVRISKISQARHLVRVTAASICVIFLVLTPARLFGLDGTPVGPLAASAGASAICLAILWFRLRKAGLSAGQLEVLTTLLCLVPILDTIVIILLTGQIERSPILMLVIIGTGAIVTTGRALILLAGATGTLWAAVVQLVSAQPTWLQIPSGDPRLGDPNVPEQSGADLRVHYALMLLASIALAVLVFLRRTAGDRALRETRVQVDEQWRELVSTQESMAESERRFRDVFNASPVGIGLSDELGHFVELNQAFCDLLGRDRSELLGRSSRVFTYPEDLDQHAGISGRMAAAGEGGVVRLEKRYIRPDGSIRWAWLSVVPVRGPAGQDWTLGHAEDVTERKEADAALQRSEAAQSAAARIARCVQSGEDPRPIVVDAVMELAGAIAVALLEKGDAETLMVSRSIGIPEGRPTVPLAETNATTRAWRTGRAIYVNNPTTEPLAQQALSKVPKAKTLLWQPVLEKGVVIALLVVGWDRLINRLDDRSVRTVAGLADEAASALTAMRLRRELESMADTDPLTGVHNRRGWQAGSMAMVAKAQLTPQPIHFGLIDFDHFKNYNDSFGHHQGDRLLRDFALNAAALLRDSDLIARWGGEEFAVALLGLDNLGALKLLNELRELMPSGQTCSIGFAQLRPDETPGDCLRRADSALYRAKREGRGRVIGPDPAGDGK